MRQSHYRSDGQSGTVCGACWGSSRALKSFVMEEGHYFVAAKTLLKRRP